jgi:DNA-binding CsgD family transcriptional regulator
VIADVRVFPVPVPRLPAGGAAGARVGELAQLAPLLAIEGPGGTGKSTLLQALADAHRRAGRTVVDAATAPAPGDLPAAGAGGLAVLVDDAHRLDAGTGERLAALLPHPSVSVALTFRPWPRPVPLQGLLERMGGNRHHVVLRHADRRTVLGWVQEVLGRTAPPGLADAVLQETGGLPALVHHVLACLADGRARSGPASPGQVLPVPAEVVERIRTDLAALDDDTHDVLHALAAGAPLDIDVVAELLQVPVREGVHLLDRGRASGWLLPSGDLVPLARRALLADTPPDVTRSIRRRLLGVLMDRGEEPLDLARALAVDGVRDRRAAELLEDHGSRSLAVDPRVAGELLAAAVATGTPAPRVAARRAHAAALCGDLDTALQLADGVLVDDGAPDRARAAEVSAAVLAHRGLLARSAELYRFAGPHRSGSAALALIAVGDVGTARSLLQGAGSTGGHAPTMLAGAEQLMAQGVLNSLHAGPDGRVALTEALSALTRAASLVEPVGPFVLLPDTPAALAALAALHYGELSVAESVLTRAISADVGGPAARPRHHLLLAWAAMLRGRMAQARRHVSAAREAAGGSLEPRDDLYLQGLEVGLARRCSDLPAMVSAWVRAREAVLRHPVELYSLLPLGELLVAAARLKDSERLAPHLTAAEDLLHRLGEPHLWATPLHWSGAQAAIMGDDPEALRPHAAALVAAARTSPYAAVLARCGRSWVSVLGGEVDAGSVIAVAEQLADVGLAWDGSRLAGQAAARTAEPRDRTALLGCARTLAETHGVEVLSPGSAAEERSASASPAPSPLSERELEVARLVVAGQTYREIGGRLFISAKTVEHHVSRMRQRLGASTRSDLMARLRAELAQGA